MNFVKVTFVLCVMISVAINTAWAKNSFRIVTDQWPPYVYLENDKIVGIDVDIALAVLKRIGIKANINLLPWKRSLTLVKNLGADAILSAAITDDRKQFLYFPSEPISSGATVFFQRKPRNIITNGLDGLNGLKVGAMLGYKYCDELDRSPVLLGASRVASLDQIFNMLMSDRIDLVVESEAVGMYKIKEMGLLDEISIVNNSSNCSVGNFLAFAKNPGSKVLAEKFSAELIKFKMTDEYKEILAKYGMEVN